MRLEDFDYELPPDQVAQQPAATREGSRLMVLDRSRDTVETDRFPAIVEHFQAGDILVLNDTRVIPARLKGNKETGGRVEIFLVRRLAGETETWLCLTRSSKPVRADAGVALPGGARAVVGEQCTEGLRRVRFEGPADFSAWLERHGEVPLPPYIRRPADREDRERYQTVFARNPGALAAPTAGLHFTAEVLEALRQKGVETCFLTLHVGLGTFLPVRETDPRRHRMHTETYRIPPETAEAVNRGRSEGRRVVALGTTAARALEAAGTEGVLTAGESETALFIYPGFRFRIVDAMVTNFHLPRSTLLMLVSAFAGTGLTLSAYRRAAAEGFRFFSYGDCMLIV